ncbi:TPA: hypothetical protein ACG3O0_001021 [Clostridioides difficile]
MIWARICFNLYLSKGVALTLTDAGIGISGLLAGAIPGIGKYLPLL